MKCQSCQSAIADTASFCPFCGNEVAAASAEPVSAQPAVPVPAQAAEPVPSRPAAPAPAPPKPSGAHVREKAAGPAVRRHVPRPAGAALRWPKSGADTAFGVLAVLFGALSLIVLIPLLLLTIAAALSIDNIHDGYHDSDIFGICVFGSCFAVLLSAAILLVISGVKACTRGRGGVLAVISAGLNLLFFAFLVLSIILGGNSVFSSDGDIQVLIGVLILAGLSLVKPLLVFICLPIRRALRRQRRGTAKDAAKDAAHTIHTQEMNP